MDELGARWEKDAGSLGAHVATISHWYDQLRLAYTAPGRAYHTLQHLKAMFAELDALSDLISDKPALAFATWFHDVVYDTKRRDNEAKSAEIAERALWQLGAPDALRAGVARLVRLSADHFKAQDASQDERLWLDVDLSVLGAEPDAYDAYVAGIETEYAWAKGPLYNLTRRGFLKSMLKRERLYHTDAFEARLGAKARANIARELGRS